MEPVIVGIDPGTTSAYAILDLDGELVRLESKKHISTSEIIEEIIKIGKPVVIASDKSTTPSKVDKICSSVGAELFEPNQDLTQEKKKELGQGNNSHEIDASASAVNAYNHLDKELRKIEQIASENNVSSLKAAQNYFNDEALTENQTEYEQRSQKPDENQDDDKESTGSYTSRLERKITRLESELSKIEGDKQKLENEIEELRSRIGEKRDSVKKEVVKQEELRKRNAIIDEKDEEISKLNKSNEKLSKLVKQYVKALKMIYQGAEVIPKAQRVQDIEGKVAVNSNELKQRLIEENVNAKHVEEIKGIELKNYVVTNKFPTENFQDIIDEYRDSR